MSKVSFTATKLENLNKEGVIKPDEDGYYELVIGGLNVFNSAGDYYVEHGARELFAESGSLQRRINKGVLRGELGHPKVPPGTSLERAMMIYEVIDEKNVICHFSKIWLDFDYGKNNPVYNNDKLIAIMALVKPSGIHGHVLKEALENKRENVFFSLRGITEDYMTGGVRHRILSSIISFDYVGEGGIDTANKWDSPATESVGLESFNKKKVINKDLIKLSIDNLDVPKLESLFKNNNFALENSNIETIEETIKIVNKHYSPPIYKEW